jgi:glycosyltransferase involved in cell wall biosynthesis
VSASTSVVIPSFNAGAYLAQALESVRAQTSPVREIIVVDDGSDEPVAAPSGWDGPPVRVFRSPNRGPAEARNTGISLAGGEFVAFLDADDLWLPTKVARQVEALAGRPDAIACYCRCTREEGFFPFGPYPTGDVTDAEFLLMLWYSNFFPPSSVLVRREALLRVGGFRADLPPSEDIELWLRLLTVGSFLQIPEPLCRYRLHAGQSTKNILRKMAASKRARAVMIAAHADRMAAAGVPHSRLWDAYRDDILGTYFRRDFAAARPLLWDYWRDHPGDVRVLAYVLLACLPAGFVTWLRGRVIPPPVPGGTDPAAWSSALARIRHALGC